MTLLFIIDNLGSGGAQNQITILARELAKKKYKIIFITYYPQDFFKSRLEHELINHIYIPKKSKFGIEVIKGIKNIINKNSINFIISFLDTPNFYATLASKLSKSKPQVLVSYRSKTDFNKLSKLSLIRKKWVNKHATLITANSHHERARWTNRYSSFKNKFSTIYNCVDNDQFYPVKIERKNTLLVVGSVGPAKNGLLVIEAIKILKENNIIVNICWIGQKVFKIDSRKNYLDQMESRIIKYHLSRQWTWLPPTKNINNYYSQYKALILASDIEGLPNVVCEAMTCGLPVIISATLDHPRIVKDKTTGFLFKNNDADSLAKAIKALIALDKDEYNNMIKDSILRSKSLFSIDSFIDKYEKLIA